MNPKYTISNDSVTVIVDGNPVTVKRGAANYAKLRAACIEDDWATIRGTLTVAKSIEEWAKGDFTVKGDLVFWKDDALPKDLNDRIIAMVAASDDPRSIMNFWKRLQRNPSWRSVQQLYPFLLHRGIPIRPDGTFLAYKSVRANYRDHHTGQIDNSPGTAHSMPRNKVSDDPSKACHFGYHVGALAYAQTFKQGGRIVICEVDPEHVVCIPNDSGQEKMRLCQYRVLGNYGARLPDTTFDEAAPVEVADVPVPTDKPVSAPAPKAKAKAKAKTKGTKAKGKAKATKADGTKPWANFGKMDSLQLLEQSLDPLRKYARHELAIIGASKIPGGKLKLVARIIEVRDADKDATE